MSTRWPTRSTTQTAAVFLEPILGEAGVIPPPAGYLAAARAICDAAGALLVIDEVQGGIGRTGRWFAHQHEGVRPDIVTLAKGLGGGLPIGACIGIGRAAEALVRGDHGSTFGGNPVVVRRRARGDRHDRRRRPARPRRSGSALTGSAAWRRSTSPLLAGVRGEGLWLALVVDAGAAPAIEAAAREQGFLVNATGPDAVRLAPPLVLSADRGGVVHRRAARRSSKPPRGG